MRPVPGHAIRHLEFRPPGDLRAYRIAPTGVLRFDDVALVAEVAVGDVVVRHYGFADRWLAINVTTDRTGRLVESPGDGRQVPPFALKCHIATPLQRSGDDGWQIDLWLDVLVRADGRTHLVEDEDEFARARSLGLLSEREADAAQSSLIATLDLLRAGRLMDLLDAVWPFGPCAPPPAAEPELLDFADFPALRPGVRPTW